MNDDFWIKKLGLRKITELSLSLKDDESIVFVADVHLSSTNENKNLVFANFLKNIDSKVKAIFFIGDLFNFYVGDPQGEEEIYKSVFDETRRLRKQGKMLFFLPGNRDFFAFKEMQKLGIMNLPQWVKLKVDFNDVEQNLLLTHGDNLMVNKHDYKFYTKIIRSSIVYHMFNWFPYKSKLKIAMFLRKTLAAKYKSCFTLEECASDLSFVKNGFVEAFEYTLKANIADVMILGHWHLRAEVELDRGKIFVIGDWRENQGAFVEYKNGKFSHEIFTDKV